MTNAVLIDYQGVSLFSCGGFNAAAPSWSIQYVAWKVLK
jgi:hypothetical protein